MDTNTKLIYTIATENINMVKVMSVISDIMLNKVNEKTTDLLVEIREGFPEYWENNQWIRYLAGVSDIENKGFIESVLKEIKEEFLECFACDEK